MLTLLNEVHFWSTHDEICVKDTDYGIFKYNDRKAESSLSTEYQCKKSYAEQRNYSWHLTNKRPNKLKDKLKELEDQIAQNRIIYCQWAESSVLQIILNTGLIINLFANISTGDVEKISFDKFLIGKLLSESISDVLITKSHFLCTYTDNQITLVHLTKRITAARNGAGEKLSRLEPKLQVLELVGPTGRKLERKLSANTIGDKLLVWWKCTRDEVYPWSPIVKDQDRANIHIYYLSGLKLELLCYRKTEHDPISVTFSAIHSDRIHCVEQKVSRKGAVTVETSTYELVKNRLHQISVTSIPLQTQVCCCAFSPDNDKLMLGCIDASVVLFDEGRGVTHLVKAAFIPTIVSWHSDGSFLVVANERSQLQYFDISLACIRTQITTEDSSPTTILDLSTNFKHQPTLSQITWNKKSELSFLYDRYLQTDSLLLLFYERGPLTILRLLSTGGARGDVHTSGLTSDVLVLNYVFMNQIDRAISVLLSLNWDTHGTVCLVALQKILGRLLVQRLTPEIEAQIQRTLGSFYAPLQPISDSIHSEFWEQVKDLTRKFFHHLVRYQLYEKAFSLAIDINDYDLFMDLYYCALRLNDTEMAGAALNRAKDFINRSNSSNGASDCSRSSCSQCSESDIHNDSDQSEMNQATNTVNESVPPLPVTHNRAIPILPVTYTPVYIPPLPTITPAVITPPTINRFPYTLRQMKQIDNSIGILKPSNVNFEPVDVSVRLNTPFKNSFVSASPLKPPVKEIVHRTVSMNIPPAPALLNRNSGPFKLSVPLQSGIGIGTGTGTTGMSSTTVKSGEKNVKFSDTVTAFIVPEISRSEKVSQTNKDNKYRRGNSLYLTDPKRELADSLPLCHPNDEYLKDFTPISNTSETDEPSGTKIKVVHFGMV